MQHAIETTTLLEGGLASVKEASTHLEAVGIASSFSMADGCKPGS